MGKEKIRNVIQKIKILILDVDGVLTDGSMYYTETGDEFKRFHTYDGMAVQLLRELGLKVAIITKENSKIAVRRARKLQIEDCEIGIKDKVQVAKNILKKYGLNWDQACYIGDDVNDVEVLQKVGLSICPSSATTPVKNIVDYVTDARGGEGVVREFYELYIDSTKSTSGLPTSKAKS